MALKFQSYKTRWCYYLKLRKPKSDWKEKSSKVLCILLVLVIGVICFSCLESKLWSHPWHLYFSHMVPGNLPANLVGSTFKVYFEFNPVFTTSRVICGLSCLAFPPGLLREPFNGSYCLSFPAVSTQESQALWKFCFHSNPDSEMQSKSQSPVMAYNNAILPPLQYLSHLTLSFDHSLLFLEHTSCNPAFEPFYWL